LEVASQDLLQELQDQGQMEVQELQIEAAVVLVHYAKKMVALEVLVL
jgi:hypothetical protein